MPSKVSGFLYTCCLYIYFTFSQITKITISVEIIILNLYLKTLTFKGFREILRFLIGREADI